MGGSNTNPGLLDAILNKNYEFVITQNVAIESKDLVESIMKAFHGIEGGPAVITSIETGGRENLLTSREPTPGPSRILQPVIIDIDDNDNNDEDDFRLIDQVTRASMHLGETCNVEGSQKRKEVDQDGDSIELARKVIKRARVTRSLGDSTSEHSPISETAMIGILSGKWEMSSTPHSLTLGIIR